MILTLAGKLELKNTYLQYNIMSFTESLKEVTKYPWNA
jgi:hypothetical protein